MAHVKYSPGNIQIWHTQKVEPYKNEKLCKKLTKVICHELAEWFLSLFRMGIFGAAHGWGPKRPLPPLPKICHTYPSMVKLGTVIPYLKKIQKLYKSCDTPTEFCWYQHLFTGNQQVLQYQEIQIPFRYIISNSSNFSWVFKDCFDKHCHNRDDVSKNGQCRSFKNNFFLKKKVITS